MRITDFFLLIILIGIIFIFTGCPTMYSADKQKPTPEPTPLITSEPTTGPTPLITSEPTTGPTSTPEYDECIQIPETFLIYYGWPSFINGAQADVALAAAQFGIYDYVVLGAGLEDPAHGDHTRVADIMAHPDTINTKFFGYIDLGVTTDNHTIPVIRTKVDNWLAIGVYGIFFDDYGYDFGVTRQRQNDAVSYVHSRTSVVCANAWNPDDAFGSNIDITHNPDGIVTQLNQSDYFLSESYQISVGSYTNGTNWYTKATLLKNYQDLIGFQILAITTNDAEDIYNQNQFFYAWYSALLYNYKAIGWGEHWFSANDNIAPYRTRPDINPGEYFMSTLITSPPMYNRETETGILWINTQTYGYGFTNQ